MRMGLVWGMVVVMVMIYGTTEVSSQETVFQGYELWAQVLSAHLDYNENSTTVNYTSLMQDPNFYEVLGQMQIVDTTLMNCDETKAFFINAYNAFAMNLLIQNPCTSDLFGNCSGTINSIREIGTISKSVWDLTAAVIHNVTYSLDDIENLLRSGITTSNFSCGEDPRFFAAIAGGATSEPNLLLNAYYPLNISDMLNDSMVLFLNNQLKGMYFSEQEQLTIVHISPIFYQYQQDFVGGYEPILSYIAQFPSRRQSWLQANVNASVVYMPYNWTLNGELSVAYCKTRACYPLWAFILTLAFVVSLIVGAVSFYQIRKKKLSPSYDLIS